MDLEIVIIRGILRLTRESFFSLKVATYLDTAVTTFWENTTCLEKRDFLRKYMQFSRTF